MGNAVQRQASKRFLSLGIPTHAQLRAKYCESLSPGIVPGVIHMSRYMSQRMHVPFFLYLALSMVLAPSDTTTGAGVTPLIASRITASVVE